MVRTSLLFLALGALGLMLDPGGAGAADLRLLAPSAPGTGWDQTARAIRSALVDELGVGEVEITNVPGGSGMTGLAQFVATAADGDLLVTGLTMLDASLLTRGRVKLDALTPIARLSADDYVIAVPSASPLHAVEDLKTAFASGSATITWAGGPLGGVDHAAALALAQAFAAPVTRVNFVPFLSAADAVSAAADEKVGAVFLALSDVDPEIKAGRLRVIATGSTARLAGIDAPSLTEAGVPFEWANWRGLVARPDLPPAEQARIARLVAAITISRNWQDLLSRRGWRGAYLPNEAFGVFIKQEKARLKDVLSDSGLLKRVGE